jgi:hypothetical protein
MRGELREKLNWQGTGWIDSDLQGDYSDGEYLVVGEKHMQNLSWEFVVDWDAVKDLSRGDLRQHLATELVKLRHRIEDELWLRQSVETDEPKEVSDGSEKT